MNSSTMYQVGSPSVTIQSRGSRRTERSSPCLACLFLLLPFLVLQTRTAGAQEQQVERVVSKPIDYASRLMTESRLRKTEAASWARQHRMPLRADNGRQTHELMMIVEGRPVYYMTANVNAAISIGVDRVRDMPAWDLNGEGVLIGLWDGGTVLVSHQEFLAADGSSRVRVRDSSSTETHATHVAGTIGAAGVDAAAKGMAPRVRIDSYDWNADIAQMADVAAWGPGLANKVYASNHSYGIVAGWHYHDDPNLSGHTGWHWWGSWSSTRAYEDWFGKYTSIAQQWDDVAYYHPYYLAFAAAGNDRNDSPEIGDTVYYQIQGFWRSITFDPETCPLGDGDIKGGYDTISGAAVAKNIVTVGAVNDAVLDGERCLAEATMTEFSSWGPTDDGRIKPDIVANGTSVYSTSDAADDAYETFAGTSMSSPTATGAAALLIQYYGQLFPGQSMRASTLKGLILHTADDLGLPGPDYTYGWGLLNAEAAAEIIQKSYTSPAASLLSEGKLDSHNWEDIYYVFLTDPNDPIRLTLCWTDPPGRTVLGLDKPTPQLVHDLDMRLISPDGAVTYYPYVLEVSDPCAPATTGDNDRDNVEQINVMTPGQLGYYQIHVNHKDSLAKYEQHYSIVSSLPLLDSLPPTANDILTYTKLDCPVTISLTATDDGLPDPPAKLTYAITSLPRHGRLEYADGTVIGEPMTLPDSVASFVYRPDQGFQGDDSFMYCADDGGVAPTGGSSSAAEVTIEVRDFVTLEYRIIASDDDRSVKVSSQAQNVEEKMAYLPLGASDIGLRFTDIALPKDVEVFRAYLHLYLGRRDILLYTGAQIHAEQTGNASDFAGDERYIPDLTRTEASVSWPWEVGEYWPRSGIVKGQWQTSPNIAPVIQEIVDREDWSEGNALALLYVTNPQLGQDTLYFHAWDRSPEEAARLEILVVR